MRVGAGFPHLLEFLFIPGTFIPLLKKPLKFHGSPVLSGENFSLLKKS